MSFLNPFESKERDDREEELWNLRLQSRSAPALLNPFLIGDSNNPFNPFDNNPFNPFQTRHRNNPFRSFDPQISVFDDPFCLAESKPFDSSTSKSTFNPQKINVNRRPPRTDFPSIQLKQGFRAISVSNPLIATSRVNLKIWSMETQKCIINLELGIEEKTAKQKQKNSKSYALIFVPNGQNRRIWVALDKGEVWDVDIIAGVVVEKKITHTSRITHFLHCKIENAIYSIDEKGKIRIWKENTSGLFSLSNPPTIKQIFPNPQHIALTTNNRIWLSSSDEQNYLKCCSIEDSDLNPNNNLVQLCSIQCRTEITCMAIFDDNGCVCGFENGQIIVWNDKFEKVKVINTGNMILSILYFNENIWAGDDKGRIKIFTSSKNDFQKLKDFVAFPHSYSVANVKYHIGVKNLFLNTNEIDKKRLSVISVGTDGNCVTWDGLLLKDWQDDQVRSFESAYSIFSTIKMFVGTWNIGGLKPLELEFQDPKFFEDWLDVEGTPELLIVNFQEVIDLEKVQAAANQFLKKKKADDSQTRKKQWEDLFTRKLKELKPFHEYVIVVSKKLVGLITLIYCLQNIRYRLSNIDIDTIKTGIGNIYGNKGGITCRFLIDDTSVCFINAHLAAHQNELTARNNDCANIFKYAHFSPLAAGYGTSITVGGGDGTLAKDHENIIFVGDLNYRIDLPRTKIIDAAYKCDWDLLLEHDQLKEQLKNNPHHSLYGFQEAKIEFKPTFKFDKRSDSYDTSEKKRIPAFCDRILYRGKSFKALRYWSGVNFRLSDHRPVCCLFEFTFKKLDMAGFRLCLASVDVDGYVDGQLKFF